MKHIFAFIFLSLFILAGITPAYCTTLEDMTNTPFHFFTTDIKFDQHLLSGTWKSCGDDGAANWAYIGSPISFSVASDYSESNLDFVTMSSSYFNQNEYGKSLIFDSEGNELWTDNQFESSGTIVYAQVWMNKTSPTVLTTTQKKGILGHEVGHCIALAHASSNSVASIMSAHIDNSGARTTVQKYDKNDISSLYGD